MLLLLYAAYDHGAAALSAGARVQTLTAALAAVVAAGVLWTGSLRLAAPRRAVVAISMLGGFALWCAVTLAWSIAPDATWTEFNRVLTYLLVLGIATVIGASDRDAFTLVARGFLLVAMAVAVYGLGQKLVRASRQRRRPQQDRRVRTAAGAARLLECARAPARDGGADRARRRRRQVGPRGGG